MSFGSRILGIVRPFTKKGWGHWVRFGLLLAAAIYVGHLLKDSPWLTNLRYYIYNQQLMMRDNSQLYPKRTALILLNDADYWGDTFQSRTPLKRDQLAELIDKLNSLGVDTLALDVDLRSPVPHSPNLEFSDYTKEDEKLFDAIRRMCKAGHHVVLASSVGFGEDGYTEMPSIYTSALPSMTCVKTGYIQLPVDMRRMPGALERADGKKPPLDSLSLAVTNIADPTAYAAAVAQSNDGFRFSEYLTPKDFAAKNGRQFIFNGVQLRTMDEATLRTALADKLVFLGANWHANAFGTGPLVDIHNSPGGMEPGLMLHANYVEAMLDRTGTFTPVSDNTAELIEIGLALVLALIGVLEIHTAWKWAAFALGILLSILFTYTLLQNLGLFLDFLVPLLMIVFHTAGEEIIKAWHELQHLKHHAKLAAAPQAAQAAAPVAAGGES
jgi:CHASE2 domain-containing sensor protein